MKKSKFWKSEWFWLLLILVIGSILRFWKISSWQHLTYDQSRDYIILKQLIVNHKFTLVGPTVSIAPGFFLPPFYYYSLVPFLWLSRFHIVGPDIYTAFFGVLSIAAYFFLAKDLFGGKAALVTSFALAINPYLVHTSRHAWNPNTIIFFILLFILSFEKYLLKKERKYFLLAGFSLGWAIGLHLTATSFLPLFFYLFFLEIKKKKFDMITAGGIFFFLLIFLPLVFFDFRHNFPIIKAGFSFLQGQKDSSGWTDFLHRFGQAVVDIIKMPAILLSGLFQKQNLTIRPSNITAFSRIDFSKIKSPTEITLFFMSIILWLSSFVCALLDKKRKPVNIIIVFFFFGLLIRLCFPSLLFYFYYYLSVFPIVYLFLANLLRKTENRRFLCTGLVLVIVLISFFSLWVNKFYVDSKPESFFLPTCEIIAEDFRKDQKPTVVAGNVVDRSRWEHNGLEYRFFLEAIYKVPLKGWEAIDYKQAGVLYFIDEGEVRDPLNFGGMEVEAFKPKKIEMVWNVKTGQKIYKMTHD